MLLLFSSLEAIGANFDQVRMSEKMKTFAWCVLLMLSVFVGCGKGFSPMGGKVSYSDGAPLTVGVVIFSTSSFQAEGVLNDKGEYTIGSLTKNDGLPAGKYKVTIMGAQQTDDKEMTTALIDPLYTNAETTPLTCEVKSGAKKFDFTVERSKK